MSERAIVDSGPLVAFLDRRETHHAWAAATFRRLRGPLTTCEPVLTEVLHLVRFSAEAQDRVLEWLGRGTLTVQFDAAAECAAVRRLMRRYRDVPMSFADASVVRMSELLEDHVVCTLDADFRVYRRDDRHPIRLVMPD